MAEWHSTDSPTFVIWVTVIVKLGIFPNSFKIFAPNGGFLEAIISILCASVDARSNRLRMFAMASFFTVTGPIPSNWRNWFGEFSQHFAERHLASASAFFRVTASLVSLRQSIRHRISLWTCWKTKPLSCTNELLYFWKASLVGYSMEPNSNCNSQEQFRWEALGSRSLT